MDLLEEHADSSGFHGAADALPGGEHAVLLLCGERYPGVGGGGGGWLGQFPVTTATTAASPLNKGKFA